MHKHSEEYFRTPVKPEKTYEEIFLKLSFTSIQEEN